MALGYAYRDENYALLDVMDSRPIEPEKPKPKHSVWSAIPRAIAAGAAEAGGNLMDVAGAFGQVAAAAGGVSPGFNPDAKKNAEASQKAYEQLKTDGIDWRPAESKPAYDFAHDLRPDPITAGAAENVVFGLTKGLTKAIGSGVVLGPVGGAASFGASEGVTTAEDLAREGVDQATRTKVGAVSGVLNAAGMALPVAGNTLAKTLTLAAAGGPASFVAQQMATRSILENADYGEIAKQYDPLDPVGLSIATLLPLGFAAAATRGGRTFRNSAKPREVVPEVGAVPTQDHIDAAMVQNLTIARDAHEAGAQTPEQSLKAMGVDLSVKADAAEPVRISEPDPVALAGVEQAAPEPSAKDPHIASIIDRVEALKSQSPDLPVALREDGTHATVSDEINAIRQQAQEGTDTAFGAQDAPLLKVAAECFLSLGGA